MSRDINLLTLEFRIKVVAVIKTCLTKGFVMTPYFTLRTPQEQGMLWCQSRSEEQISQAAYTLIKAGAPFLASCIDTQYAGNKKWATNALPGNSWHQWGQAVDCFLNENGVANWNSDDIRYKHYADVATQLGLTSGRYWLKPDPDHIQLQHFGSPLDSGLTWLEIEAAMLKFQVHSPVIS